MFFSGSEREKVRAIEAFSVPESGSVYIIGGGGKTTLMFLLAKELASSGRKVLTTTTTRINEPEPWQSGHVEIQKSATELVEKLSGADFLHITVASGRIYPRSSKLKGYSSEDMDFIQKSGVADLLIVEADGAAGRSIKAHAEHEPVISEHASAVIAVVGIDCLGKIPDENNVHRSDLFRSRLSNKADIIRCEDVVETLMGPEGWFSRIPKSMQAYVVLSKVSNENLNKSIELADMLLASDRFQRIKDVVSVNKLQFQNGPGFDKIL